MSVRESGDVICNRYELVERIGAGGHGEIWSAIDEHDGQKVALKFLRDDLASSVEAWAILNHESQMARRLNHPGILRSGTPMRDEEQTVMPMEYAGGGDLKRLRGQSYLRSVPVLIRIAEILAHAHARGVVHRDLKPGNVLFDEQGNVRLADFGAAGLSGSTHSHAQGSPFTASPQQLQDLPAAPGDDIYGLGALAYELLSGQPPYYPNATPDRVLREPVPDLVPAQPAPARLVALIMRMLAKDPAARPATMLQVVEGLNQALSDTLIVDDTEPSEVVPSLPDRDEPVGGRFEALRADRRPPAPPRLLPAAGWLGAAGVAGAVLVALLVLQPWRPGAAPRRETAPDTTRPPPVPPASEAAATPTAPPTVTPPPPAQAPPAAGPDPRPAGELSRHVERGREALGLQRYTDARHAFERALAQRPDDAAASEGLAAVEAALAADGYEGLRREGLALEGQERWHEARDAYERALAQPLPPRFASTAYDRARVRSDLSDRLDAYLEQPSRLATADGRREAEQWIGVARDLDAGPVLRSQIARVRLLLQDYARPVTVSIASDGDTLVTILRIGELGRFAERSVSLPPGEYVVVGTRPGYREVRRPLQVRPGAAAPPIRIACTEPTA